MGAGKIKEKAFSLGAKAVGIASVEAINQYSPATRRREA
jgi:hypothetical protein